MPVFVVGAAAVSDQSYLVGAGDIVIDFGDVLGASDSFFATGPFPSAWEFDGDTGLLTIHTNAPVQWTGTVSRVVGAGAFSTTSFTIAVLPTTTFQGPNIASPKQSLVGEVLAFSVDGLFLGPGTYSLLTGLLPSGASAIDPVTGLITGTLTTQQTRTGVSFRKTGPGQVADTNAFDWNVTQPLVPPVLTSAYVDQSITLGSPIVTIPSHFTGAASYSIAPAAGAGLTFNTGTGALSGTPSGSGKTTYIITATAPDGSTLQGNQFFINVSIAAPTFTGTITTISGVIGQPIARAVASFFTGLPVTFSLSPARASISIDPNTGVISGTIDAIGTTTHTVTATNASGAQASNAFDVTGTAPAVSQGVLSRWAMFGAGA